MAHGLRPAPGAPACLGPCPPNRLAALLACMPQPPQAAAPAGSRPSSSRRSARTSPAAPPERLHPGSSAAAVGPVPDAGSCCMVPRRAWREGQGRARRHSRPTEAGLPWVVAAAAAALPAGSDCCKLAWRQVVAVGNGGHGVARLHQGRLAHGCSRGSKGEQGSTAGLRLASQCLHPLLTIAPHCHGAQAEQRGQEQRRSPHISFEAVGRQKPAVGTAGTLIGRCAAPAARGSGCKPAAAPPPPPAALAPLAFRSQPRSKPHRRRAQVQDSLGEAPAPAVGWTRRAGPAVLWSRLLSWCASAPVCALPAH